MAEKIPKDAYVMIIGAMKCGTTFLYTYMGQHPEICLAREKEPEYFTERSRKRFTGKNYEDLWDFTPSVHKYVLEASTGYTKYPWEPNAARNIRDHGIQPRFIYIIRDPFDRIQSHYNFLSRYRNWKQKPTSDRLVNISNYYLQLEQYRRYFPGQDVLLLDFDELSAHPEHVAKKVYDFLGLSNVFVPASYPVVNPTEPYSKIEQSIKQSRLGRLYRFLPQSLKKAGKSLIQVVSPPNIHFLTNKERQFVYNRLKDDMIRLQDQYHFDVGKWGFGV